MENILDSVVCTWFKKGCLLNCCTVHCALLHTQTAMHHGCNEFLNSIAAAYYETATFV